MNELFEAELKAELEAFRADVRRREAERERDRRQTNMLDLPMVDLTTLELPQIKALIAQRYADARYEKRLRALERRVADLEAGRG